MVLWRAMPLSQEDDTLDELMAYGNGARVSIEENPLWGAPVRLNQHGFPEVGHDFSTIWKME